MNYKKVYDEVVSEWKEFRNVIRQVRQHYAFNKKWTEVDNILNDIVFERIKLYKKYIMNQIGLVVFNRIMTELKKRLRKSKSEGRSINEDYYKIYIDNDTINNILNEEVTKWNKQTDYKLSNLTYQHYDQFSPDIITGQIKCDFWDERVEQIELPNWEQYITVEEHSYDILINKINEGIDKFKSDIYLIKVPTKDFCIQTIEEVVFNDTLHKYLKQFEDYTNKYNSLFQSELETIKFKLKDYIIHNINNPLNKK